MMRSLLSPAGRCLLPVLLLAVSACASAPESRDDQAELESAAAASRDRFVRKDPSLEAFLGASAGYVVFPKIGEGGFIIGAGAGTGVLYENGAAVGYVTLREGSFGAQIGGRSFSELLVLENADVLRRLKEGTFDVTAEATAVAARAGAAASTTFDEGVAIFIDDEAGLMAEASFNGQSLRYTPKN